MADDDDAPTVVNVVLYPPNCEEVGLRNLTLGMQHLILLEGDDTGFTITGSMIDSYEEMLELMGYFAELLKQSIEQEQGDRERYAVGQVLKEINRQINGQELTP
jgi:hypothetical protein